MQWFLDEISESLQDAVVDLFLYGAFMKRRHCEDSCDPHASWAVHNLLTSLEDEICEKAVI